MFTNFEKAFFKQNEIDQKIPAEVMQSLNEKLPEGFVYTDLGEGAAGLLPNTGGDFQLSGFSVQLPADLPDDLKPSTFFELIEYMYRTQTKIKLISKNNIIKINNKEFDIDELLKLPFSDLEVRDSEFYMVPKPFQNPFKVILESDEVKREFLMKRQPYPHIHKSLFKSIDNSVLEISYLIDEINNQIKFNFTLDIDKTKDIKQLIEALKIYKACMNGHIKINKQPLPQATDSKTELTSIDENINFWVKVLKLQSLLGVNFIPTSEIKHNDVLLVEELYRGQAPSHI
ncbi:abortive infection system toxin AbiGii family protein [Pseudomonas sivasensis]|uniref:abortive infection system toxin AbiGii family protein n=1 Tax=Pseudomonas sivasensis TaxID=1880678 RepID=UPI003D06E595